MRALCVDAATLTNPIRDTLCSVAEALNRWHFVDPVIDNSGNLAGTRRADVHRLRPRFA